MNDLFCSYRPFCGFVCCYIAMWGIGMTSVGQMFVCSWVCICEWVIICRMVPVLRLQAGCHYRRPLRQGRTHTCRCPARHKSCRGGL